MEMCLNHKNVGNKGPQSLTIDDVNKQFLDDAQNAAINKKEIRNIYVIRFLYDSIAWQVKS